MPRQARLDAPGTLHHAILRGIARGKIVAGEGVGKTDLRSGIRTRAVVMARRLFCQVAVREMGYSGAGVPRFLGVATSAVNPLAVAAKFP
jgi:hypothetical protein